MNIEAGGILLTAALYMACLFALAWCAKRDLIPARFINNPLVYVLTLGISINTWSFYTSVEVASFRGYGYLAYYLGYSLAFLFAPVFLLPILRITKAYQLSSMADLFAFRFRSPLAGTLTTLVLLVCIFPLLALQLIAISASAGMLFPVLDPRVFTLGFCVLALLFTLMFGASDHPGRDQHRGVVVVLAFEALFKLAVLTVLGLFALYGVFGGPGRLEQWLETVPPEVTRLDIPFLESSTNLVVLLFFTAAIAMPHMFHMTFKENSNPDNLKTASWGLPLMLLIASLPALPVLWAGEFLDSPYEAEFSALAISVIQDVPAITGLTFTGGLAAATGIFIVIALALSNMCVNHLLLPVRRPRARTNLYDWLLLRRRLLIAAIIAGGYLCYLPLADGARTFDVGYVTFIACVQFLPGILTLLYWPAGNRKGFISGLIAGVTVWFLLGLLPLFTSMSLSPMSFSAPGQINWDLVTSLSLVANILALVLVSLTTQTTDEERTAGRMCSMDPYSDPRRLELNARTPAEFIERLARPLGRATAEREVLRALRELGLDENESRPYPIQRLRDQIEANISGLLGPTIANQIVDRFLPYELLWDNNTLDVSFLESRLEAYPGNLSGVAVDLDNLRRHHRQVLQDLPLGVCSIGANGEISLWNNAMEKLTGVTSDLVTGFSPATLPDPWKSLLKDFINDDETTHIHKHSLMVDGRQRWVSLHKATIEKSLGQHHTRHEGLVIVAEDLTEHELLEEELTHAERLASIGRLAAGVAHEIGNPITGIACLAQNIRDETDDSELREMAEQIIDQTNRASRIVQALVNFSRGGSRHSDTSLMQEINLHDCVTEAIQLASLNKKNKAIAYVNDCDADLMLHTDKQRLQQVMMNLLSNARDASAPRSTIHVTGSITDDEQVSIAVTDQGKGIPPELQDRVFDPFFTTKDPGQGTGLGLALVYSITEDLGGNIRIESPVDPVCKTGTRIIVTFPGYRGKVLQKVENA